MWVLVSSQRERPLQEDLSGWSGTWMDSVCASSLCSLSTVPVLFLWFLYWYYQFIPFSDSRNSKILNEKKNVDTYYGGGGVVVNVGTFYSSTWEELELGFLVKQGHHHHIFIRFLPNIYISIIMLCQRFKITKVKPMNPWSND